MPHIGATPIDSIPHVPAGQSPPIPPQQSRGRAQSLAENVPSPAHYAEVISSRASPPSVASTVSLSPSPPSSPDSANDASHAEAAVNDGILRALLLRRTERQERARACPVNPEHVRAETAMRELKRYLGSPLFITQTGDGPPGRWASDAWIPDEIRIMSDCTDPYSWRCLQNPGTPGKSNMNHVRLQFSVDKGRPGFSVAQIEAGKIRCSQAVELPPGDPMALCRAVATAKLIAVKWSWRPFAASDEDALALLKTLLRSHAVDEVLNRIADWLIATRAEAAMPHPGNAMQSPALP